MAVGTVAAAAAAAAVAASILGTFWTAWGCPEQLSFRHCLMGRGRLSLILSRPADVPVWSRVCCI